MDEDTKRLIDYQGECSAAFQCEHARRELDLSSDDVKARVNHIFENANPEDGTAIIRAARVITDNLSERQIKDMGYDDLVEQSRIQVRVLAARGVSVGSQKTN